MSLAELTQEKHDEFFKLTHTAGVMDQKTKQLIHTAVVLALRCEP
ncbi:hypothetical protein [Desulfofundulus thermobenzoicus]|nr:hypothetical protein [Desulfofundulus thermobenzoicus]